MARPESSTSLLEQPGLPRVIINPDVLDEDVPYSIQLDREGCAAFLEAHGMNPGKIPSQTIELRSQLTTNRHLGRFKKKKMILACDTIWKASQGEGAGYVCQPNSVFQHEAKHAIDSTKTTYRVSDFVTRIGMVGQFAYVMPALTILTNLSLWKAAEFAAIANVAGTVLVGKYFDKFPNTKTPWERRAEKFVDEVKDDPRWKNLVTLQPKNV